MMQLKKKVLPNDGFSFPDCAIYRFLEFDVLFRQNMENTFDAFKMFYKFNLQLEALCITYLNTIQLD